jgi:hypothetical protein
MKLTGDKRMANASNSKIVSGAEVSARKIIRLPIQAIKPTPYNPAKRTAEGKKLTQLVNVIQQCGVVYPIIITEDGDLADGNRRLAACKLLGHTHIECIVSELQRDDIFNAVNSTQRSMASSGWLEIARSGRKVPARYTAQYDELLGLVGIYGIDLLIKNGLGMNSLRLCKSIASLDPKYIAAEIIMTVATHRLSNRVSTIYRMADISRGKKVALLDAIFSAVTAA